jgi:hypothetical protein
VATVEAELITQQAADVLGVSRPQHHSAPRGGSDPPSEGGNPPPHLPGRLFCLQGAACGRASKDATQRTRCYGWRSLGFIGWLGARGSSRRSWRRSSRMIGPDLQPSDLEGVVEAMREALPDALRGWCFDATWRPPATRSWRKAVRSLLATSHRMTPSSPVWRFGGSVSSGGIQELSRTLTQGQDHDLGLR